MRTAAVLAVMSVLVLAGCGGEDSGNSSASPEDGAAAERNDTAPKKKDGAALQEDDTASAGGRGTTITLARSEFGSMLFGPSRQAVYVFQNDRKGESVCYDECAEAWPPVFTKGKPKAGKGVADSLLGTTKRRDGKLQVTYAGRPIYFYAHEGPGEVRCHNVNLNGGLWWVVGPDGRRRP